MSATRPAAEPLVGRFVRLDPLVPEDAPALFDAIAVPDVFAGGYGGGPAGLPADVEAFGGLLETWFPFATGIPYIVRVVGGSDDGRVVGTTSLADFDETNRGCHIGWTAYAPAVWGGPVNVECKLLLLGCAFDHGFDRVKLQADAVNARSRAAISKLGATFEGVLRHDRVRADGSWRDTAVYSILSEEWPTVREGLEVRLARFTEPVAL